MCYVQFIFIAYFLIQVQTFSESTSNLTFFVTNNSKLKYNEIFVHQYGTIVLDSFGNKTFQTKNIVQRDTINEFQPQDNKVQSTTDIYKIGFSVSNDYICPRKGKNIRLIVIVISNPRNYLARTSIRETWGKFGRRKDIRVFFLLGVHTDLWINKQTSEEQKIYNDIIQRDFLDIHSSTNLKTISALEWLGKYCSKTKFLLKVHDNVFINMPQLITFVKTHMNCNNTIFARFLPNFSLTYLTMTKNLNKFSPSRRQPVFAPVLLGHMYLLTNDTVDKLFYKALEKRLDEVDDIFITAIIAKELKINCTNVDEFICQQKKINSCNLHHCIGLYDVQLSEQYYLWKKLFACDLHCPRYNCYQSLGKYMLPDNNILFILTISNFIMNMYQKYVFL